MKKVTSYKLIDIIDFVKLKKTTFNNIIDSSPNQINFDDFVIALKEEIYVGDIIVFKSVDNETGSMFYSFNRYPFHITKLIEEFNHLDKDLRYSIYEYEFPVTEFIEAVN